jgi:hypothetical protein
MLIPYISQKYVNSEDLLQKWIVHPDNYNMEMSNGLLLMYIQYIPCQPVSQSDISTHNIIIFLSIRGDEARDGASSELSLGEVMSGCRVNLLPPRQNIHSPVTSNNSAQLPTTTSLSVTTWLMGFYFVY